jgi:phosphopantothenoylcysteine decarboxylase/phosphopantothenate--cysteine ligase
VESLVPVGPRPWDGLRVLVTAGGTREPIDAVRFVGNRSSGRMGVALAEEAAALGARVTVVAANVALPRSPVITWRDVESAAELEAICREEFPACDVLLMAAAVADFTPVDPQFGKLKKSGRDALRVELQPTTDVLSALSAMRSAHQTIVGFAAEHGAGALDYGREKLARKRLDAIVVNDVSAPGVGFDAVENEVTVVTAHAEHHVPRTTKAAVACAILDVVSGLRATHGARA